MTISASCHRLTETHEMRRALMGHGLKHSWSDEHDEDIQMDQHEGHTGSQFVLCLLLLCVWTVWLRYDCKIHLHSSSAIQPLHAYFEWNRVERVVLSNLI